MSDLVETFELFLSKADLKEPESRKRVAEQLVRIVQVHSEPEEVAVLRARLETLYEYEKRHLDLLQEYKEEIKFANSLQEDLRRERAQLYSQVLRDAASALKQAEVDKVVAAEWIQDLVRSYTESLNTSMDLVNTRVVETLGDLGKAAADQSGQLTANGGETACNQSITS